MKALLGVLGLGLTTLFGGAKGGGQAIATATGPGSYLAVGGGISGFQTDYGHTNIAGTMVYVDVNPEWRVGFEGEARWLRYHADEQVTESTYLCGVRVSLWKPHRVQPYAKFLAGAGEITLPFEYAHGGFLTYAPGAGLDVMLGDQVSVRVVDVEYQRWPRFVYGSLQPFGVSGGVSIRLSVVSRHLHGPRKRN